VIAKEGDTSKRDYQQVRRIGRIASEEKKAMKAFYDELQNAINDVDWSKVRLPKLHC
jgi:hypothetical protein